MKQHVLYFAYGSNMNPVQMKERCPGSKTLGAAVLRNYRLTERRYADIDRAPGSTVHGVLYEITPDDLKELNRREGYPSIYTHLEVEVEYDGGVRMALTYEMTPATKEERDGTPYSGEYRKRCSDGAEFHHVPNEFATVNIIAYGTLMTGEPNHGFCRNAVRITPCIIRGALYDTGYGFPAFVPEGDAPVRAELIQIPVEDWPDVDRLEGCPDFYRREFNAAELADGSTAGGWVYIMNRLPARAEFIASGDWKNREDV